MNSLVAQIYAVTASHGKGTVGLYSIMIFDDRKVEMIKVQTLGRSSVPIGSKYTGFDVYIDIDMKINVGDTRTSKIVAIFEDLHDAMDCFLSSDLVSEDYRWKAKSIDLIKKHSENTPGFKCGKRIF